MKKHTKRALAALTISGLALLASAPTAGAHGPTCEDMFGSGWKNHGAHVLTYVNGEGGAAGGAPAHRDGRPDGPAPGASFCLGQSNSPGVHFG